MPPPSTVGLGVRGLATCTILRKAVPCHRVKTRGFSRGGKVLDGSSNVSGSCFRNMKWCRSSRRAMAIAVGLVCLLTLAGVTFVWRPWQVSEGRRRQLETGRRLSLPLESRLDLGNGVTLDLVLIPPGEFMMGSEQTPAELAHRYGGSAKARFGDEKPQSPVRIERAFYIGVFEVTQAQYAQVMGENPSHFKGRDLPVETLNWRDALKFCEKATELTGRSVRLPTEAEWEYACRAGTATPFVTGRKITKRQANYGGSRTVPVGSFRPNAFGLHDMPGNVDEWCRNWYGAGDPDARSFVSRGGAWDAPVEFCRSASRYEGGWGGYDRGFRIVVEVAAAPVSPAQDYSEDGYGVPNGRAGWR